MTSTQAQTFAERARQQASGWKQRTPAVPDEARVPAPYIRDGNPVGCHPYCLPPTLSACNLLPQARAEAHGGADADIAGISRAEAEQITAGLAARRWPPDAAQLPWVASAYPR